MNRIKNVKDKHKKVSLSSYDVINRFMVAVVVSMMVLIGLLFFTAVKSVNRYTRLIYISNSRALLQSYATAVSDEIDGCFSDLSYCVYADVVRTDDPVKIVNWLQGRRVGLPSYAMNLFFCGRDGVCHSYNGRKFNAMYTDYFKAIMIDHEQRFVTDPRVSPVTGLEEFIVCRAVHNSRNENIGLFGFSVLVMRMSSYVSSISIDDTGSGFILNSQGVPFVKPGSQSLLFYDREKLSEEDAEVIEKFNRTVKEYTAGVSTLRSKKTGNELVIFTRLDGTPWTLGMTIPEDFVYEVSKKLQNQLLLLIILFAIACAASLLIVMFVYLYKSNKRLASHQTNGFDPLTGLWAESRFEQEMNKMLALNPDQNFMLAGIDIRSFRLMQQEEGVNYANDLLVALGRRIARIAEHHNGICARGATDHFYLLIPVENIEHAMVLFKAFYNGGRYVKSKIHSHLATKTGICYIDSRDENLMAESPAQIFMGNADYARRQVRKNIVESYAVYDENMRAQSMNDRNIERFIPEAFEKEEFYVVFQPKMNIASGKIIGAEALVRWKSSALGEMRPDSFIGLFERNGYIRELDFYVYRKVFEFISQCIKSGEKLVPISVNMSRVHLSTEDFVDEFSELFSEFDIPEDLIEIEILERSVAAGSDNLKSLAAKLHEKGFKIAIDDFGSGESSLDMLSEVPVDVLKLDQKFMRGKATAVNKSIIKKIIEIARSLGTDTICEGVETSEQIEFLRSVNCHYVQGFYYSRPLMGRDFLDYISEHS